MPSAVAVDIDGMLTNETEGHDYATRTPNLAAIKLLNLITKLPNVSVYLFTSRYSCDEEVTRQWLKTHGVLCQTIVFDKPKYDLLADDRAV